MIVSIVQRSRDEEIQSGGIQTKAEGASRIVLLLFASGHASRTKNQGNMRSCIVIITGPPTGSQIVTLSLAPSWFELSHFIFFGYY